MIALSIEGAFYIGGIKLEKTTKVIIEEMLKIDTEEMQKAYERAATSVKEVEAIRSIVAKLQSEKAAEETIKIYLQEEQEALEQNRKDYEEFKVLEARVRVNKRILKRTEKD